MDLWNAIGLLVLGWLFGLLGPVIVRKIEQDRYAEEIRNGITAELKELASRLAITDSLITMRFGEYNKQHVEWVINTLEASGKTSRDEPIIDNMKKQLSLTDEEFLAAVGQLKAKDKAGLGLKKNQVPYLTSKIGDLPLFSENSQRDLLEILTNLQIFNEEVDMARYYFKLTYDGSITPENHARAESSVKQSYLNVSARARIISDAAVTYLNEQVSSK